MTLDKDGFLTVRDDGRGIPIDAAPEIQEQVRARSHHDDAALGRQILEQGLPDRRRPARRRHLGRQRAVRRDRSRGRARPQALPPDLFARQTDLEARTPSARRPTGAARRSASIPTRRSSATSCTSGPSRLFAMARSKAYLSPRRRDPLELRPQAAEGRRQDAGRSRRCHYPNGLADMLKELTTEAQDSSCPKPFTGRVEVNGGGAVEWAVVWSVNGFGEADGFSRTYCNTIPTPEGGTHEAGMRSALTKGLRAYGEMIGNKKTGLVTADDVLGTAGALLSVFIRNPEFVGQTKEKLSTQDAFRITENAMRDRFDHWLTASTARRQPPARMGDRPGRRPDAQAQGQGSRAPVRHAQAAPARQARRLLGRLGAGHRTLHRRRRLGRRLRQAGARSRHAGGAPPARQDPQRRQRRRRQAVGQQGTVATSPPRSAPASAIASASRTCATSASSS